MSLPDNREDFMELVHCRLPASVDPGSPLGQHYAQLIQMLRTSPPIPALPASGLDEIAVLLRRGRPRSDAIDNWKANK